MLQMPSPPPTEATPLCAEFGALHCSSWRGYTGSSSGTSSHTSPVSDRHSYPGFLSASHLSGRHQCSRRALGSVEARIDPHRACRPGVEPGARVLGGALPGVAGDRLGAGPPALSRRACRGLRPGTRRRQTHQRSPRRTGRVWPLQPGCIACEAGERRAPPVPGTPVSWSSTSSPASTSASRQGSARTSGSTSSRSPRRRSKTRHFWAPSHSLLRRGGGSATSRRCREARACWVSNPRWPPGKRFNSDRTMPG